MHDCLVDDELYGWFSYDQNQLISLAEQLISNINHDELVGVCAPCSSLTFEDGKFLGANVCADLLFENQWSQSYTDLQDSIYEEGGIKLKLVFESILEPLIYVKIDANMIDYIIEKKIPVYYDYFDNGFGQYYEEITRDTFIIDCGYAVIFDGEVNVVNKKDYNNYQLSRVCNSSD